jgi:hypothetical protein
VDFELSKEQWAQLRSVRLRRARIFPRQATADPYWMSIEVLHGAFPADQWRRAHGEDLTTAAIGHGACQLDGTGALPRPS